MDSKVRVCTHVWSYGTFKDIDVARRVAKMVIEEEGRREVFIKDANTNRVIETIKK